MLETFYKSEHNTGTVKLLYKFIKENGIQVSKAFFNDAFNHVTPYGHAMSDQLKCMEMILDTFMQQRNVQQMTEIILRYDKEFHTKGKKK